MPIQSRVPVGVWFGIRLVVYCVLVAMLWAMVVPKLVSPRPHANQTKAVVDIANFQTALEAYRTAIGEYPSTKEGLSALTPKYIGQVLVDPWGRPYMYRFDPDNPKRFDLFSTGPSGIEGNPDNIRAE